VAIEKVRLDSAIRNAMANLEIVDSTQDDLVALSLLEEIYAAIPGTPNAEESYLQALVYDLAKTAFNGACASGKISTLGDVNSVVNDPNIEVMQDIISNVPTSDDLAAFLTNLDQTLFTHTEGFLDTTLIQMDSLLEAAVTGFQSYLVYLDCYFQAEKEVVDGLNSIEGFEALIQTCNGNKWLENDLLTDGSLERFAASLQNLMTLRAYPSPMSESVWVDVQSPKGVAPNFTFWDAQGRLIQLPVEQEIRTDTFYRIRMKTSGLSAGMYILRADADGQVLTQKLIKE
jgi:hypothetical protein